MTTPSGEPPAEGSCIVVVATDAPLSHSQCERVARRAGLGLARTGSTARHGSGEIFCAFSTTHRGLRRPLGPLRHGSRSRNTALNALFAATVEATEEAVLNSLFVADTVVGVGGRRSLGLPHDRVLALLARARSPLLNGSVTRSALPPDRPARVAGRMRPRCGGDSRAGRGGGARDGTNAGSTDDGDRDRDVDRRHGGRAGERSERRRNREDRRGPSRGEEARGAHGAVSPSARGSVRPRRRAVRSRRPVGGHDRDRLRALHAAQHRASFARNDRRDRGRPRLRDDVEPRRGTSRCSIRCSTVATSCSSTTAAPAPPSRSGARRCNGSSATTSTASASAARSLVRASDLYGTAFAADDLALVLDALEIDKIDLYGDSYGTFFGQAFAVRHGDRLRTLVLDSSYPGRGAGPLVPRREPRDRRRGSTRVRPFARVRVARR